MATRLWNTARLLESHVFYKNNSYNFTRGSVQRKGLIKRKGPGLILGYSSSEVTKVMICQPRDMTNSLEGLLEWGFVNHMTQMQD